MYQNNIKVKRIRFKINIVKQKCGLEAHITATGQLFPAS